MNQEIRTRLKWVQYYQSSKNLSLTCHRCGISRPTLRKWLRRYEESGLDGLISKSRKPNRTFNRKIFADKEQQVLLLRYGNNLGARRIQNELKRQYGLSLSLAVEIKQRLYDTIFIRSGFYLVIVFQLSDQ